MTSHTSTDSSISTTSPSPKAPKSSGPTAPQPTPSKPSPASKKAGPDLTSIKDLIPHAALLADSKKRAVSQLDENALASELRAISVALARATPETNTVGHRTAIPAKYAQYSGTFQKILSILHERDYHVIAKTTGNFAELFIS